MFKVGDTVWVVYFYCFGNDEPFSFKIRKARIQEVYDVGAPRESYLVVADNGFSDEVSIYNVFGTKKIATKALIKRMNREIRCATKMLRAGERNLKKQQKQKDNLLKKMKVYDKMAMSTTTLPLTEGKRRSQIKDRPKSKL